LLFGQSPRNRAFYNISSNVRRHHLCSCKYKTQLNKFWSTKMYLLLKGKRTTPGLCPTTLPTEEKQKTHN
jgi:hypothetical protein